MRCAPERVFAKDCERVIGAPQDYNKNKESESFPDSFDLRIPGAGA